MLNASIPYTEHLNIHMFSSRQKEILSRRSRETLDTVLTPYTYLLEHSLYTLLHLVEYSGSGITPQSSSYTLATLSNLEVVVVPSILYSELT